MAREKIKASQIIALPGCYPTATLLGLKPLIEHDLLDLSQTPVVNATSGVSGAGRQANLNSSFCEVSLHAYGVHVHRHIPEIEEHAKTKIIFTPHLANFKRGILATITAFIKPETTSSAVKTAFEVAYSNAKLVRLTDTWPKVDDVAYTPYCDLHWQIDTMKNCIIVCSAIDNLLKGAASQAIQCANVAFGLDEATGLV